MSSVGSPTPTMDSTTQVIKDYILDEFLPGEDPNALTDSTPLLSSNILDSLATLKLVEFLQARFDIQIQAHEAVPEYLDTLSSIAGLVRAKQKVGA